MKQLSLYIFLVLVCFNAEAKAEKNVTWQVFVKLTGEMGNNSSLPSFNAKETSKIKSAKDQKKIVKKLIEKTLHKCEHSNVKWTMSLRGNKICTLTVVKYFDEDNPENNNKYVNLSGIKFDDLIISINGLEKLTPEKIEEIEASQKKLSEEKVANAKNMCNVSKPIYNWTMCLGTQIDNQNKFKYVGQWKDGDFHGQGTWTYESGEKYVGEWKFGKRSGQGTEIFPSGMKYVGEFKNDKRNGQGTQTFKSGMKYVGEFKNDLRNGQGTETFKNGWKYVGEFENDLRNGQGISEWKGEKYVGEFKNDLRNGQGTLTLANGKKESGVWKDDNLLTKKEEKSGTKYVYQYAFEKEYVFSLQDPTTFKNLIFEKEEKIPKVTKALTFKDTNKGKTKTFRAFSFIGEYEDNISIKIFVEYNKDSKDYKEAEKKALYFANMFGQMPYFLKEHAVKIYIHRKTGKKEVVSPWWVRDDGKSELHINESRCGNYLSSQGGNYSNHECVPLMIHELAHLLKFADNSVISNSKWKKARKLDKKFYCTKYAKINIEEDFAESVMCWIGARYKSNKIMKSKVTKMNEFIPNRLKFFDDLNLNMHPWKNIN